MAKYPLWSNKSLTCSTAFLFEVSEKHTLTLPPTSSNGIALHLIHTSKDKIIKSAMEKNASDIHIEPMENCVRVRYYYISFYKFYSYWHISCHYKSLLSYNIYFSLYILFDPKALIIWLYSSTNYPIVPVYANGYNGKQKVAGYVVDRSTELVANGFTVGEKEISSLLHLHSY